MFKVQEESIDLKSITVFYDKCGIDLTDLHSLLISIKTPKRFDIVFDNSSEITATTLLNSSYLVNASLSAISLTGKETFDDGIYEFDSYILYNNSHNISANKDQNEVTANNILNDFQTTDLIYIAGEIYTIDKVLSTQDVLVLTEPLKLDAISYKVAKQHEVGFFGLYRHFNNWLVERINQITNCVNCQGKIVNMTKLLTYLLGLVHNIDCQDLEGAKTIFNYLKQVQQDDNCC